MFSMLNRSPKKAIAPRFKLVGIVNQPVQTCSACKKS
jgi:hypothetical protein